MSEFPLQRHIDFLYAAGRQNPEASATFQEITQVLLSQYATITRLQDELKITLVPEQRLRVATAMMHAILSGAHFPLHHSTSEIAICYADALIARLQKDLKS